MFQKVKNFGAEVRAEMGKVTWSTREELIGSTAVVLAMMFFLSVFIGFADLILSFLMQTFLR